MTTWSFDIFGAAPTETIRNMMLACVNMNEPETIDEVFLAVNNGMMLRQLGGDPDLPVPSEDFASIFVDAMNDEELRQAWDYCLRIARELYC
jgi:hypothetical protein